MVLCCDIWSFFRRPIVLRAGTNRWSRLWRFIVWNQIIRTFVEQPTHFTWYLRPSFAHSQLFLAALAHSLVSLLARCHLLGPLGFIPAFLSQKLDVWLEQCWHINSLCPLWASHFLLSGLIHAALEMSRIQVDSLFLEGLVRKLEQIIHVSARVITYFLWWNWVVLGVRQQISLEALLVELAGSALPLLVYSWVGTYNTRCFFLVLFPLSAVFDALNVLLNSCSARDCLSFADHCRRRWFIRHTLRNLHILFEDGPLRRVPRLK